MRIVREGDAMQQAQMQASNTVVCGVGFNARLSSVFKRGLLLWDRQRQRRVLLDLDDHQLRDIGKTREDALIEGRKPFWK
jgi:uncharacterized protein YjiS (DUF1127 family)